MAFLAGIYPYIRTDVISYLERLWGAVETAKFIAVTTVIPNLMSFGVSWLAFVVFQNADLFL